MDKSTLLLLLLIAAAGGGYYTYKNSPEFRNKVNSLTSSFCKKACTGCGDHDAVKPEAKLEPTEVSKPAIEHPEVKPDIHPTPAVPVAKAPAAPVMTHPAPKPALVHPAPALGQTAMPKAPAPAAAPRPA